MAFGSERQGKIFSEINITPLTDIFLVLLIIMMVVAPVLQSNDTPVEVPEINNGVNIEESKVAVSVTADGLIYVNGAPTEASKLTDALLAVKNPDDEKQEVVVKADKNVASSKVLDIMDAAQNAEYKKLIVAGEPLNKKEQKILQDNAQQQENNSVNIPTEDE
ncbi:biopolymer transporter ExbD [bacterium]|nr:biopolymer transporter ExbD [bacterium]